MKTFWLRHWVVIPMGYQNAPANHQRRMNQALRKYIGVICRVYPMALKRTQGADESSQRDLNFGKNPDPDIDQEPSGWPGRRSTNSKGFETTGMDADVPLPTSSSLPSPSLASPTSQSPELASSSFRRSWTGSSSFVRKLPPILGYCAIRRRCGHHIGKLL